jgi:hypothetical protein
VYKKVSARDFYTSFIVAARAYQSGAPYRTILKGQLRLQIKKTGVEVANALAYNSAVFHCRNNKNFITLQPGANPIKILQS